MIRTVLFYPKRMSTNSEKDDTEVFRSCDSVDRAEEPRITDLSKPQETEGKTTIPNCDDYFKIIKCGKRLPICLQETLTCAFSKIPVSSFAVVNQGKVIEIPADTSVAEAMKILSESNILSTPVVRTDAGDKTEWRERYLGIIDYSAIILWVLETAEMAAAALLATSATAAGVRSGALATLGIIGLDATGPASVAGMGVAAVGATVSGDYACGKVATIKKL